MDWRRKFRTCTIYICRDLEIHIKLKAVWLRLAANLSRFGFRKLRSEKGRREKGGEVGSGGGGGGGFGFYGILVFLRQCSRVWLVGTPGFLDFRLVDLV